MTPEKGIADFIFNSSSPGKWNLTMQGNEAWMHLTLASPTEKAVVRTVSTNDIQVVMRTLITPGEGLVVRSFQAVFASDFPDNAGLAVAEVYDLSEGKTKKEKFSTDSKPSTALFDSEGLPGCRRGRKIMIGTSGSIRLNGQPNGTTQTDHDHIPRLI